MSAKDFRLIPTLALAGKLAWNELNCEGELKAAANVIPDWLKKVPVPDMVLVLESTLNSSKEKEEPGRHLLSPTLKVSSQLEVADKVEKLKKDKVKILIRVFMVLVV